MADTVLDFQTDPRLTTQRVTLELIQYIADKIVRAVNPQKIILFGSWARGEGTADSDVDLFIVHDSGLPNREVYRRIARLLWGRLFGVDLIVRNPQDVALNLEDNNPFYTRHIFGEGKVLYERPPQAAG
jgi:predicted nucleotidyltransferase